MFLDTCALLWLVEGGGQLKTSVLEQIGLSSHGYISVVIVFEISLKYQRGKLELPLSSEEMKNLKDMMLKLFFDIRKIYRKFIL